MEGRTACTRSGRAGTKEKAPFVTKIDQDLTMVHRIFMFFFFFSCSSSPAVSGAAVSLHTEYGELPLTNTGAIRHKSRAVQVCQYLVGFLSLFQYFLSFFFLFTRCVCNPTCSTGSFAGPDGQLRQRMLRVRCSELVI